MSSSSSSSGRFKPPPTITRTLIEDLKADREKFKSGQWMYSKKYGKKVKYLGTFHLPNNGVVSPIVFFSYPQKNEDAIKWNTRFLTEKKELQQKERLNRNRYPKVQALRDDYKQKHCTQEENATCLKTASTELSRAKQTPSRTSSFFAGLSSSLRRYLMRLSLWFV